MSISFNCPVCHNVLQTEPAYGGQQTQCPYCRNTIMIPTAAPGSQNPAVATGIPPTPSESSGDLYEQLSNATSARGRGKLRNEASEN